MVNKLLCRLWHLYSKRLIKDHSVGWHTPRRTPCIASSDWIVVYNEPERMWKETAIAQFNLSISFSRETLEDGGRHVVKIKDHCVGWHTPRRTPWIASSDWIIVYNEPERMWKETAILQFNLSAPIFKGDPRRWGPTCCTATSVITDIRCVTAQRREDVFYIAAEAPNPASQGFLSWTGKPRAIFVLSWPHLPRIRLKQTLQVLSFLTYLLHGAESFLRS